MENPTGIPSAATCSHEVLQSLVADGVLSATDCTGDDIYDLSRVADAVYGRQGVQRPVVDRLSSRYNFKTATPNEGYLIAAALLAEGVVYSVVTLNFDLAMTAALMQLGVGHAIGIIESPADLPQQQAHNVFYLHRNANAADPETWVLRSATLQSEWKGHWEPIIASKVLSSPIVVFAGLGTPVSVLVETTSLIRTSLSTTTFFQVDPIDKSASKTFAALNIPDSAYVQMTWCAFMSELAPRVVKEVRLQLAKAITAKAKNDNLREEDPADILDRLEVLGLVRIGMLRATWLLHNKPYCPDNHTARALLADIALAVCMIARERGVRATIAEDGLIDFERDGRVIASYVIASGSGHHGRAAIEAELRSKRHLFDRRRFRPQGALIAGTSDFAAPPPSPPADLLQGNRENDIVVGATFLPMTHIHELRLNPAQIAQVVP